MANELFDKFRENILSIDPVAFCENNLTLDGDPFKLNGNGYKPFNDIYRYIAITAIEKESKKVVLVKGRQVGATTMAAALECYFCSCGLFGNNRRPPVSILHLFPTIAMAGAYTKDKLDPMISHAKPVPGVFKQNGTPKSFVESRIDSGSPANDTLHYKKFMDGNKVWIESTGITGDRIRGRSADVAFFDECFPYNQQIETENGKIKIGDIYKLFVEKKQIPLVKTYNESKDVFEYKKVLNAWNRGVKDLMLIKCCNRKIKCTYDHKFLTSVGWVCAKDLKPGMLIKSTDNYESVDYVSILNITDEVYDIEVEDNHNFIVLSKGNKGGLIAHNCQDITPIAVGAITKSLAQSKYGANGEGVQVYFGTPKQKGGHYWKMWQHSSQQYFHLRCEKCNELFPLYRPDVNWEDVWLYGYIVKCTHCGHEQDKRKAADSGSWVAMNLDAEECSFVGYHINQLYIPKFTKETIIKAKPENSTTNTEKIFQNEVLGEFFDGDGGSISIEEIHEKCSDAERGLASYIEPSKDRRVYAGFDWGQRSSLEQIAGRGRGQSFSCGVVLTAHGPKLFSVDFATRLARNDQQSRIDVVEEMFRKFGVYLAVGDIGDANSETAALQRMYPERFLASRSNNQVNGHVVYRDDIFPKEILFEKDYYIGEIIGLLKSGSIRFPYKSYSSIDWLINHCASMEVKVIMDRSGEPIKHYVKGSAPNDGLMALLNAYLAWKFDVTNQFRIKQPHQMRFGVATGEKTRIPAVLGYLPMFRNKM